MSAILVAHAAADLAMRSSSFRLEPWVVVAIGTAVLFFALFVGSNEPFFDKFTEWRSRIGYALVALAIVATVKTRKQINMLVKLFVMLSAAVGAFGIVQYMFRTHLPAWALSSSDTVLFSYYGTDITRANGLVGNTIVFGALMTLAFSIVMSQIAIAGPSISRIAGAALFFAAIVFSFSRVALVGCALAVGAALVLVLIKRGLSRGLPILVGATLVISLIAVAGAQFGIGKGLSSSFVVSGLFSNSNASVQGSTAGHLADIQLGEAAFAKSPMVGIGIGTQSQTSTYSHANPVITDGAFWQTLTEGGVILVAAYGALFLLVFVALCRTVRETGDGGIRAAAVGLTVFMSYTTCVASFVNSAYFGKAVFVSVWVLFGLLQAARRVEARSVGLVPSK
jgi:O-antigen ligase